MLFAVVRVICVFVGAVIFVVFVCCEVFQSRFLCKFHGMDGVSVGDVGVVSNGGGIVFFISLSSEQVVLCGEFEVVSGFAMCVKGLFVEFVIVFGGFVMFGHRIELFGY